MVDGMPVADMVQQWWDLLDLAGEDRREGTERLRVAIIDRTILGAESPTRRACS